MRNYLFFSLLLIMVCLGCGEKPIFSKKITISEPWTYDESLQFSFEIEDLESKYDLILSLTYSTDFDYQNVYVKITTSYPNGEEIEDVLSLNLTDGMGKFLGKCGTSKCTVELLLQEMFKFKSTGNYRIAIHQYGREQSLNGIYAAQLKLYRANEGKTNQ